MHSFLKGFLRGLLFLLPVLFIGSGILFFIKTRTAAPVTEAPKPISPVISKDTAEPPEQPEAPIELPITDSTPSAEDEPVPDDTDIPSEEEGDAITLSFAGDMLFTEYPISRYNAKGVDSMASEELLSHMTESDLFMVNQEFPFSLRGEAIEDKTYTFRVDPKYVSIFQDLGVDIVTVANNHALDFGIDAFTDSLDTLDQAQIARAGGGRTLEEARTPVIKEFDDISIGFLAASRVIPVSSWSAGKNHPGMLTTYDPAILNQSIKELKETCDYAVVYVHWGIEKDTLPQDYQRELARGYIDAGADAVIGSHPHVMQGFEFYKGKPIAYSLGNFLFSNSTNQTVLYKITINPDGTLSPSILPCIRTDGQMQLMPAPEDYYTYLEELSFDVSIDASGNLLQK